MIGAAVTIICYVLLVRIVLEVSRNKGRTLAIFAFIPTVEIRRIIESTQSISIRKARYTPALVDFKENTKDGDTIKEHKPETQAPPMITGIQYSTQAQMVAIKEGVEDKGEEKSEEKRDEKKNEDLRDEKKKAHLYEGKYLFM